MVCIAHSAHSLIKSVSVIVHYDQYMSDGVSKHKILKDFAEFDPNKNTAIACTLCLS